MSHAERRFQGVLERNSSLGWTVLPVPFAPREIWPEMIRQRVRGAVTGPSGTKAFRNSLFPTPAEGGFFLLLNRAVLRECGLCAGAAAEVTMEPDLEPRPAEVPGELECLLEEADGLREWYGGLSEAVRREIGKWIYGVQGDAARLNRAQQMAERLLSTMEAEQELPPVLQKAFQLRPRAQAGWRRMTPGQRRSELMAVFYYRSPEAQARRIEKMLIAAESRAE